MHNKTFNKKNGIFLVPWNDKDAVSEISNTHADLSNTSVKQWNPNTETFIKLVFPNCNTEYKRHIAEVDSLDSLVCAYGIDVCRKK